MGYRHIMIQSASELHVRNNQLMLKNTTEEYTIPLEDIDTILIDRNDICLSAHVLQMLSSYGICLYVCGKNHLPNGVLIPYASNTRQTKMIRMQFGQSKPALKRLWQQIITAKISNQAECLSRFDTEKVSELNILSQSVQSGDAGFNESKAAAIYFRALFGSSFNRREETVLNAALNYGYAIIRGTIAKQLVLYGLEPSAGIFHRSELNTWNLADDLIEPYRPVVDFFVRQEVFPKKEVIELSPKLKQDLYRLLNVDMLMGNERCRLAYAVEKTVQSLQNSFLRKESLLSLPQLIGLEQHRYE